MRRAPLKKLPGTQENTLLCPFRIDLDYVHTMQARPLGKCIQRRRLRPNFLDQSGCAPLLAVETPCCGQLVLHKIESRVTAEKK